jgi:hypothetical protein
MPTDGEQSRSAAASALVATPKFWLPIRESLESFSVATRRKIEKPHSFRFVSQAQAVPAAKAIIAFEGVGSESWRKPVGYADTRAAIYDQSFSAQKLKAFVIVSMVSCLDHAELAALAIDQGRGGMPITLIRGLIERIALASSVESAIAPLMEVSSDPDKFMDSFYSGDYHSVILKSLYGTRVDWIKLASSEIAKLKRKEYEYKEKEDFADEGAEQILNRVDKLSNKVAGTRLAYDVFCEFLHPNSGDLYSATQSANARIDKWGTRHITRRLGVGERIFSSEPQLAAVLSSSLDIASAVLGLGLDLHEKLDDNANTFLRVNRLVMHGVRKKQRHLFKQDDLCPCLSGKTIHTCK